MINQFKDYDKAKEEAKKQPLGRLPKGPYICEILGVKLETIKTDKGEKQIIKVQFDIAEGEYAKFFRNQFEANKSDNKKYKGQTTVYIPLDDGTQEDGWTKNTFAKWTNALEESNEGYTWDWDESKWRNKKIGLVFGETGTVIDGKEIVYTECRYPVSVEAVKTGKAGEAKFKAKNGYGEHKTSDGATDFVNVPDGIEEELPF